MTNQEAAKILEIIRNTPSVEVFNKLPDNDDTLNFDYKEALNLAIKALEFAESQRLCCDNCVNRNYKSKEVCTSPYGMCEFFDDETQ